MNIFGEQKRRERDIYLEVEDDIMCFYDIEKHWKYISEENNENERKVCDLRWKVYIKDKEDLINRGILVVVLH